MVPDHEIDIANSITLLFEEEEEDEEESPQHSSSTKIIRMVQEVDPPRSVSRSSTPQKSLNNTVVPQFSLSSDISVGKLLGAGGFCVVRAAQITAIGEEAHQSAIKMPRPCTNDEQQQAKYELTIKDMKNEAGILAGLSHHQNIINLKGVSRADEPATYFLILGRLDYTLSQQMSQWRETLNWRKSSRGSRRKALQTRLEDVAIGIANGLEYLHKKGIVHRDIKPENIGFNEFDTPVLFDFGLARQCQPDDDAKLFQNMDHAPDFNDSTVSMMSAIDDGSGVFSESTNTDASGLTDSTGLAGTPRYMAPEIARGKQHGTSADVYSFSILVWELATLKRPYHKYKTFEDLDRHVFNGNERPSRRSIGNTTLRDLLKQSWSGCAAARPPVVWLRIQLEQTVQELSATSQSDGTPQRMKPWVYLKKQRSSRQLSQGPLRGDRRQQRRSTEPY